MGVGEVVVRVGHVVGHAADHDAGLGQGFGVGGAHADALVVEADVVVAGQQVRGLIVVVELGILGHGHGVVKVEVRGGLHVAVLLIEQAARLRAEGDALQGVLAFKGRAGGGQALGIGVVVQQIALLRVPVEALNQHMAVLVGRAGEGVHQVLQEHAAAVAEIQHIDGGLAHIVVHAQVGAPVRAAGAVDLDHVVVLVAVVHHQIVAVQLRGFAVAELIAVDFQRKQLHALQGVGGVGAQVGGAQGVDILAVGKDALDAGVIVSAVLLLREGDGRKLRVAHLPGVDGLVAVDVEGIIHGEDAADVVAVGFVEVAAEVRVALGGKGAQGREDQREDHENRKQLMHESVLLMICRIYSVTVSAASSAPSLR